MPEYSNTELSYIDSYICSHPKLYSPVSYYSYDDNLVIDGLGIIN